MKRIFQTISGLFSFETLFVLYLFAGQYKRDETLIHYFNPPDLTPILFAASVAVGVYIFVVNKLEINRSAYHLFFIFLIFVCYAGLSLSWSQSLEYGSTKTMYLGIQNFWNLIAAAIIMVSNQQRLRRLMFGILVMSLIYVVMSLPLIMNAGHEGAISIAGSTYDGVSFVISAGVPVLVCYMIDSSLNKFARVSSFALCCIYFFILLFVGHRGFLISTVIAMGALVFLIPNNQKSSKNNISVNKKSIILIIMALLSMIVILQLSGTDAVTVSRLSLLSDPAHHGSTAIRLFYYKEAFRMWSENPIFGAGIGSFPIVVGLGDMRMYPHNIILELLAELGLVGLLIFGFLLFYGVRVLQKNFFANSPLSFFVFLVFVTSLIEGLFSSDISDHRILMVALGLMMFPQETGQMVEDSQPHLPILSDVRHMAHGNL